MQGELCILDSSVLGGVSISGKMLQKHTPTTLPSSSEIVLTRAWNPITSSKQLQFKQTTCTDLAPQSGHRSLRSRLPFAWPLLSYRASKTALLPALNSSRSSTTAQTSTLDILQTLLPQLPAAGRVNTTVLRKSPLYLKEREKGRTARSSQTMTILHQAGGTSPHVPHLVQIFTVGGRV
jgi:hypothetical protein